VTGATAIARSREREELLKRMSLMMRVSRPGLIRCGHPTPASRPFAVDPGTTPGPTLPIPATACAPAMPLPDAANRTPTCLVHRLKATPAKARIHASHGARPPLRRQACAEPWAPRRLIRPRARSGNRWPSANAPADVRARLSVGARAVVLRAAGARAVALETIRDRVVDPLGSRLSSGASSASPGRSAGRSWVSWG